MTGEAATRPLQTAKRRHWPLDSSRARALVFDWLVVCCVAIPGFSTAKFVLIMGWWGYLALADRFRWHAAIWFCSVALSLLLWCVVALFHYVPLKYTTEHFARMMSFFVVLGICGHYVGATTAIWSGSRLDSLIFRVAIFAVLFKVSLLVLILSGVITVGQMEAMLGVKSVTDSIGFDLIRLQLPGDVIAMFLLACYVGGRSRLRDALFLFSIAVITYLSFSRFMFFAFGVALVTRAIWLRRIDVILWLSILVGAVVVIGSAESIYARFVSHEVSRSDSIRSEQMAALSYAISTGSVTGAGLGGSASEYIRSESQPYFYEVQWYAMAMQFGFIGLGWLALNFMTFFFWNVRRSSNVLYFWWLTLIWLMSGFTNPYLTGLGSAFGLTILVFRCNLFPAVGKGAATPRRHRILLAR